MNKREFLDILKQSLNGEVSQDIIDQNIRYYDDYISSHTENENVILNDLGDPRLIARTIIESNRAAKQKNTYSYRNNYSDYYTEEENQNNDQHMSGKNNMFFMNFKWYHKIVIAIVIILALILLVALGRIIIGLFFVIGLPIIVILLLLSLFRRR